MGIPPSCWELTSVSRPALDLFPLCPHPQLSLLTHWALEPHGLRPRVYCSQSGHEMCQTTLSPTLPSHISLSPGRLQRSLQSPLLGACGFFYA